MSSLHPIRTLLVANRGEIARRVFRTCRHLGIGTVAVYSEADRALPFVREADRSICIGPPDARASYLNGEAILRAARDSNADAIHPGYGFLAENADFAQSVLDAGLVWVGPSPEAMRALGDKVRARKTAAANDVPTVPGYDEPNASNEALCAAAEHVGFPLLIKASAGGGGRGMRRVDRATELPDALASARREALSAFGSDALLLERLVERPRHIEVQVLGDQHRNIVHLFERECSIQRRHQKIVEESPSSAVDAQLREKLGEAAVRVARAAGYSSAGTVEFLVDRDGRFYLLEMNARLQVEHPVTEFVTGLDLVALQIAIAEGRPLPFAQEDLALRGHAIEARLYAEDPNRGYLPSTGQLVRLDLPAQSANVRVDSGYETGDEVGVHYDAMLAKLVAWGPDRATATRQMRRVVEQTWAPGVTTNLPLLREIFAHPAWRDGELHTYFLEANALPSVPPLNLDRGALAATVVAWWRRRSPNAQIPTAWRLEGPAWSMDRWRCGTDEVETSWRPLPGDRLEVRIGSTTSHVAILAVEGEAFTVEIGERVERWRVATSNANLDDGDTVYVHLGDGEAFVQLVPRFPPPTIAVEPGSCTAPTPGRVSAVLVVEGQTVSRGQALVVLEAMKMEHRVTAPCDGVVERIAVAPGDQVAQGARLVQLAVS